MIIEHEILEQILDEDWPLSRVIAFLEEYSTNAWQILLRHAQEGNVILLDDSGSKLLDWKVQEIVRNREAVTEMLVSCTRKGADLVT